MKKTSNSRPNDTLKRNDGYFLLFSKRTSQCFESSSE